RLGAIAAALGVGRGEIAATRAWMRRRLAPYPLVDEAETDDARASVRADVVVRESPTGELEIELTEPQRLALRVDPAYKRLAADPNLPADERARAAEFVRRARDYLDRLSARWQTLARVARCAVEHQGAFVRLGPHAAVALTRAQVAAVLGLHESTVSR